jgi:hypothetical protein
MSKCKKRKRERRRRIGLDKA